MKSPINIDTNIPEFFTFQGRDACYQILLLLSNDLASISDFKVNWLQIRLDGPYFATFG